MQFVHPSFLWALTALSIPIVIHLFQFRRYKKLVFSNVRLLKQLSTQNKSKQTIKDWLILLCRILLITSLVFAFAQPFIPIGLQSKQGGNKMVSIFVDNSFSMNAVGREGVLLEDAKAKARAIIQAFGNADKFQILTNNLTGAEQRFISKSDAIQAIDAIIPSTKSASCSQVYQKMQSGIANQNSNNNLVYFISDFQLSQHNLSQIKPDTNIAFNFIVTSAQTSQNISIDSVYLESPIVKTNQTTKIAIKITNHGKEQVNAVVVTLKLNQVQKGLLNLSLNGGEQIIKTFDITLNNNNNWVLGEVAITDYPITYDDNLYFTIKPNAANNILLITDEKNHFIETVYANDNQYKLTQNSFGNINYQNLNNYSLIILNEAQTISSGLQTQLNKYLDEGGSLLVIPNKNQPSSINPFLASLKLPQFGNLNSQSKKVNTINIKHPLFSGVYKTISKNADLPIVKKYFPLQSSVNTNGIAVANLNNDDVLLWESRIKKGSALVLAMPVNEEYTNLPMHSLFVPMMLNAALAQKQHTALYYTLGKHSQVNIISTKQLVDKLITIANQHDEFTTEWYAKNGQMMCDADAIKIAGWYNINEKKSGQLISTIAFNNSRTESALDFANETQIEKQTSTLVKSSINSAKANILGYEIAASLSGKILWRWFVLAALIFILAEVLLLKLK